MGYWNTAPDGASLQDNDTGLVWGDAPADLLDEAQVTQALERIWVRVRRLNQFVEENRPWQLAKEPEQAERLAVVLRSLAEGLRSVTVLLHPYLPGTSAKLLEALGAPAHEYERATFGAGEAGAAIGELPPLFPKPQ